MRWLALFLIAFYQKISTLFLPARCKYLPTCSQYAKEAFSQYSFLKAGRLTFYRILRCNPWARGGYDPLI
ncbi:MAG: membrane protein insertion efficiency factor YidD [Candidatus Omnitrophica bacterium]|nr:membrane protein insertion efficiency factor YidD [Candidatus Omnitrophota bacterium]